MAGTDPSSASERRDPAPAGPAPASEERDVLPLWEESVSFDREKVETGRVRVRVVTRAHEETVEVPLTSETVEVQRIPIGRLVEAVPPRRREGDVTIIPVVEEVAVVERRLVLKEELRLRLVRTTEPHRHTVTLRRQEAVVERLPPARPSTSETSG
jgi:uncharacterized protein (TIGR02271 family)